MGQLQGESKSGTGVSSLGPWALSPTAAASGLVVRGHQSAGTISSKPTLDGVSASDSKATPKQGITMKNSLILSALLAITAHAQTASTSWVLYEVGSNSALGRDTTQALCDAALLPFAG